MRLIDADLMIANGFKDKTIEVRTEDIIKSHEKVVKLLFRDVVDFINKQPTVDAVERKKGEWIFEPKDAIELMFTKPKCSKCGYESADGGNFCSNCGADMRTKETDRDYERAVEQLEHDMLYEPTYNPDDGSM
jgi:tRNA(Ile2) C34 agmatinyltransferase TiaS